MEHPTKTSLLPPLRPPGTARPADGLCTYPPCGNTHHARGLCRCCYRMVRLRDEPEFRAKVNARHKAWRDRQAGAR